MDKENEHVEDLEDLDNNNIGDSDDQFGEPVDDQDENEDEINDDELSPRINSFNYMENQLHFKSMVDPEN